MADKKVAAYGRVSTDEQAQVKEGSLKNQEQVMRQYVEMKSKSSNESWAIADMYIDAGKSGKDTNRPEYQRMMDDIRNSRANTVLCTALSRISRSVRDLLDMIDFFKQNDVDFICLKENFDTTTAQGKCFITIMGALNQFEREQTSERTHFNMYTRAQRGFFHGGYLLGYDPDPSKKGSLVPNPKEAELVNHVFDTYLSLGSVEKTAAALNEEGYTSKSYVSSTDKERGGKKFVFSAVLNILTNLAYVGIREINKMNKSEKEPDKLREDQRYITCKASWEPIVEQSKFDKVQFHLKDNLQHKYNGMKSSRHYYLLNGGFLSCHRCGSRMEGRSAYGHKGKIYYYYYCVNRECGYKVREDELEAAIQYIVKGIISRPSALEKIASSINVKLHGQLPRLKIERQSTERQIEELGHEFSRLKDNFLGMRHGRDFVESELAGLDDRKMALNKKRDQIELEISVLENKTIDAERVEKHLLSFDVIFKDGLTPSQKRSLIGHVLTYIKLCDNKLKLGIDSSKFHSDITSVLRRDSVCNIPRGSQNFPWGRQRFEILATPRGKRDFKGKTIVFPLSA